MRRQRSAARGCAGLWRLPSQRACACAASGPGYAPWGPSSKCSRGLSSGSVNRPASSSVKDRGTSASRLCSCSSLHASGRLSAARPELVPIRQACLPKASGRTLETFLARGRSNAAYGALRRAALPGSCKLLRRPRVQRARRACRARARLAACWKNSSSSMPRRGAASSCCSASLTRFWLAPGGPACKPGLRQARRPGARAPLLAAPCPAQGIGRWCLQVPCPASTGCREGSEPCLSQARLVQAGDGVAAVVQQVAHLDAVDPHQPQQQLASQAQGQVNLGVDDRVCTWRSPSQWTAARAAVLGPARPGAGSVRVSLRTGTTGAWARLAWRLQHCSAPSPEPAGSAAQTGAREPTNGAGHVRGGDLVPLEALLQRGCQPYNGQRALLAQNLLAVEHGSATPSRGLLLLFALDRRSGQAASSSCQAGAGTLPWPLWSRDKPEQRE